MAIADDLTSILLIVAAVLAVSLVTTVYLLGDTRTEAQAQEQRYMQDYYHSATDAFLHLKENRTGQPYNVLLGDYVYTGRRIVPATGGHIDIASASKEALDALYGPDNYYLNITPVFGDAHISFVIDGTRSLRDERQTVAENVDFVRRNVTAILNSTEANVNVTVYVMSASEQADACQQFAGRGVTCRRIGFEHLYGASRRVNIRPPDQYNQWNSYARANPDIFYQADWVAGTLYADEQYKNTTPLSQRERTLHIIVPVADKLSTNSVADSCLSLDANDNFRTSNYVACSLCDDNCPVGRSARYLPNVTKAVNESGVIVIPVFSSGCSYEYHPRWSQISNTPITRTYASFPVETTLCAEALCGGCDPGPADPNDLDSFCFHNSCHAVARQHMEVMANGTGGTIVDLSNIDDLPQKIVQSINTSISKRSLEIGTFNESRTRYVVERNVLLPNYGKTTLRFWVYEEARP